MLNATARPIAVGASLQTMPGGAASRWLRIATHGEQLAGYP
jgi:hypothetical protein